tara:strand:+ start:57141 stop:57335 length:195 start_codon:yes stop_codon:yes gene_type:complete
MTKNEIISGMVGELLTQRGRLNSELININFNEPSSLDKKIAIENSIVNIDMQLDRRICETESNV